MSSILENHFNVDTLKPIIEGQFQTLKPFIRTDPYINRDEEYFDKEIDVILTFIMNRNGYLKKELAFL
jgi:spore coat protein H